MSELVAQLEGIIAGTWKVEEYPNTPLVGKTLWTVSTQDEHIFNSDIEAQARAVCDALNRVAGESGTAQEKP